MNRTQGLRSLAVVGAFAAGMLVQGIWVSGKLPEAEAASRYGYRSSYRYGSSRASSSSRKSAASTDPSTGETRQKGKQAAQNATPSMRQEMIHTLHRALQDERDPETRLYLAKCLIRASPNDVGAARDLVDGLSNANDAIRLNAFTTISDVIPSGPAPLVRGLVQDIREGKADRGRAALLLSKVNASVMNR